MAWPSWIAGLKASGSGLVGSSKAKQAAAEEVSEEGGLLPALAPVSKPVPLVRSSLGALSRRPVWRSLVALVTPRPRSGACLAGPAGAQLSGTVTLPHGRPRRGWGTRGRLAWPARGRM